MMDLEFKNGDPGAVKHGNFINYSSFHPAITRLNQIPMNVFKKASKFIGFDVGCNAGVCCNNIKLLRYPHSIFRI